SIPANSASSDIANVGPLMLEATCYQFDEVWPKYQVANNHGPHRGHEDRSGHNILDIFHIVMDAGLQDIHHAFKDAVEQFQHQNEDYSQSQQRPFPERKVENEHAADDGSGDDQLNAKILLFGGDAGEAF